MNIELNFRQTGYDTEVLIKSVHQPVNVVIKTINNPEGLYNLRNEWNRFAEQFQNPLLSYDWFLSCIKSLCNPDSWSIVILRVNGTIRAIAPLSNVHRFGINHLEIIGTKELMEPTSLLSTDINSFKQMMEAFLELKKPLILKRLILNSELRQILIQQAKKKSFITVEKTNSSQWIAIESSWEDFEKRMKSSQRSRIRRFRRRLEEKGKVQVEIYSDDSENFRHALSEAFQIEASGWKSKNGTAVLTNKVLQEFFTAYLSKALNAGILRLFLLKVNGKGIAMIIGVEYGSKFWILKVGYDEQWAHFAPGIIIHHESIKWAFEKNLKGYEFLGVSEQWINTWTDHEHNYYTYWLFPKTLNGLLCFGIEGINLLSRKIFNAIRSSLKNK